MVARRSRGEGGLTWNEQRQRWIGRASVGFTQAGKRRIATVSGRTKTEAKAKLRALLRDHDDGLPVVQRSHTVEDAVEAWIKHGLVGRDASTVANRSSLARTHILPALGRRKLVDLTAEEVDGWLTLKARTLSTETLQRLLSILRQSIRRAQSQELVRRNVALLCDVPRGTGGRPSKSLTLEQARALLAAAEDDATMHAYVVLSLMTGARTEELRALTWNRVDLDSDPPTLALWRSVRAHGDTKTTKSRRTLELPRRCVIALRRQHSMQHVWREQAADRWVPGDLVFTTSLGTALDAANVRRSFRRVVAAAGLNAAEWTPRELRHSFVSLMSSSGMPIEDIAHLVGHAGTRVTEQVYRKELRPILTRGAAAMDSLFADVRGELGKQLGKQGQPDRRSRSPADS